MVKARCGEVFGSFKLFPTYAQAGVRAVAGMLHIFDSSTCHVESFIVVANASLRRTVVVLCHFGHTRCIGAERIPFSTACAKAAGGCGQVHTC